MKWAAILALGLSVFSTNPALAAEGTSELNLNDYRERSPEDIHFRLVPQLGMSTMAVTGKDGSSPGNAFSGGLTTEIGTTKQRLLETGLLYIQTSGDANVGPNGSSETLNTSQLAIPLMAKIRFIDMKSQAWYMKIGALTDFQTSTNHADAAATRSFDVIGAAGIGARLPLSKQADLIFEATYNRSTLSAFQASSGLEGFLFTGISVGL